MMFELQYHLEDLEDAKKHPVCIICLDKCQHCLLQGKSCYFCRLRLD